VFNQKIVSLGGANILHKAMLYLSEEIRMLLGEVEHTINASQSFKAYRLFDEDFTRGILKAI
jgi:hypothetical protein